MGGTSPPGSGARGFGQEFWTRNYAEPERMDGVHNAVAHATFLRASFDVVLGEVHSVVDLGFGLGFVFQAVLEAFAPYKALGIEPSPPAFLAAQARLKPPERTKLRLEQVDLASWCARPDSTKTRFDLGVCTSVLQYLGDEELEAVIPVLARRVRYLYLTVPTAEEFEQQARDEQFVDPWAVQRPRSEWRALLGPHFTAVGARLLESRHAVQETDSRFTDHLYRESWDSSA
jgi:hypothetical protein